jgi:hypothetical protein
MMISKVIPVPWHYAMEAHEGVEKELHAFLTSAIQSGDWVP